MINKKSHDLMHFFWEKKITISKIYLTSSVSQLKNGMEIMCLIMSQNEIRNVTDLYLARQMQWRLLQVLTFSDTENFRTLSPWLTRF